MERVLFQLRDARPLVFILVIANIVAYLAPSSPPLGLFHAGAPEEDDEHEDEAAVTATITPRSRRHMLVAYFISDHGFGHAARSSKCNI